jgi:hypothetical protein
MVLIVAGICAGISHSFVLIAVLVIREQPQGKKQAGWVACIMNHPTQVVERGMEVGFLLLEGVGAMRDGRTGPQGCGNCHDF